MLKRLYAHNFRTLVNFEWRPPQASVLVGRNGAGKSAIFEVLWMLRELVCEGKRPDEGDFGETHTAWVDLDLDQIFELELDVNERHFLYRLTVAWRDPDPSPALTEELRCNGALLYEAKAGEVRLFGDPPTPQAKATFHLDRRRSFIAALEARPDNKSIIAFRDALASIWLLKPDPQRVSGTAPGEEQFFAPDLSNFASVYRAQLQENPDAAEALRADLREVIDGFHQLRFERVSTESKSLRAEFRFQDLTHDLRWDKLSDGQRLLIGLYGVLHFGFPNARLILLDEIENYVSPQEIQPWLRKVTELVHDAGKQLILISHHPEAIDYLAADSAWRVWRDPQGGHSRIERLEPDLDVGETAYELTKRSA